MQDKRNTFVGLVVGGFVVILPVLLAGLLLERIYRVLQALLHPLLDALPGTLFANPPIRALAVGVAIVGLLLFVGLLARTRLGTTTGRWLEIVFLNRLPFYGALRNLASGLAGRDDQAPMRPVLVEMSPGAQQLGLVVERHSNGSATVFFPESPNPAVGTVVIVEGALMRELGVPARRVFQCFSRWGQGMAAVCENAATVKGGGRCHQSKNNARTEQ